MESCRPLLSASGRSCVGWSLIVAGATCKALLLQNFGANLTLLLGIIGAVLLLAYSVGVARDRSAEPPKPGA